MDKIKSLLDALSGTLTGEPARIIGYGGAVIIYIAAKVLAIIPDQTAEQALTAAVAAIVVVGSFVESIRHFVYSQNTVQAIADHAAATGYATVPPPPADETGV